MSHSLVPLRHLSPEIQRRAKQVDPTVTAFVTELGQVEAPIGYHRQMGTITMHDKVQYAVYQMDDDTLWVRLVVFTPMAVLWAKVVGLTQAPL